MAAEETLDAIKETLEEIRDAIQTGEAYGAAAGGGAAFYIMIGIGWGFGIVEKSGNLVGAALSGLFWPISLAFQLARYYSN